MGLFLETTAAAGGGMGSMIVMMLAVLAIMYFLMIRPENKKKKEAEQMRSAVKVGDKITTIGGVVGVVCAVKDDKIVVETSADRVRVEFAKWAISSNEGCRREGRSRQKAGQGRKEGLQGLKAILRWQWPVFLVVETPAVVFTGCLHIFDRNTAACKGACGIIIQREQERRNWNHAFELCPSSFWKLCVAVYAAEAAPVCPSGPGAVCHWTARAGYFVLLHGHGAQSGEFRGL